VISYLNTLDDSDHVLISNIELFYNAQLSESSRSRSPLRFSQGNDTLSTTHDKPFCFAIGQRFKRAHKAMWDLSVRRSDCGGVATILIDYSLTRFKVRLLGICE